MKLSEIEPRAIIMFVVGIVFGILFYLVKIEPWPLIFAFPILGIVGGSMIQYTASLRKKGWITLKDKLYLNLDNSTAESKWIYTLDGNYNGMKVRLMDKYYTKKESRPSLWIEVLYKNKLPVKLQIYSKNINKDTIEQDFEYIDIKSGWEDLDELVDIKGTDEKNLKEFLSKPGLKENLQTLFSLNKFYIDSKGIFFKPSHYHSNINPEKHENVIKALDQLTAVAKKLSE
ncbi:MAG: hypothetical protein OEV44_07685 [Spirochaetota bacterium]|nr:hypothetical protein [Spirochaetota bacterium]